MKEMEAALLSSVFRRNSRRDAMYVGARLSSDIRYLISAPPPNAHTRAHTCAPCAREHVHTPPPRARARARLTYTPQQHPILRASRAAVKPPDETAFRRFRYYDRPPTRRYVRAHPCCSCSLLFTRLIATTVPGRGIFRNVPGGNDAGIREEAPSSRGNKANVTEIGRSRNFVLARLYSRRDKLRTRPARYGAAPLASGTVSARGNAILYLSLARTTTTTTGGRLFPRNCLESERAARTRTPRSRKPLPAPLDRSRFPRESNAFLNATPAPPPSRNLRRLSPLSASPRVEIHNQFRNRDVSGRTNGKSSDSISPPSH